MEGDLKKLKELQGLGELAVCMCIKKNYKKRSRRTTNSRRFKRPRWSTRIKWTSRTRRWSRRIKRTERTRWFCNTKRNRRTIRSIRARKSRKLYQWDDLENLNEPEQLEDME